MSIDFDEITIGNIKFKYWPKTKEAIVFIVNKNAECIRVPDAFRVGLRKYTVVGIDMYAFYKAKARVVYLPATLELIDANAFAESSVEKIFISGTHSLRVNNGAFQECLKLTNVDFDGTFEFHGTKQFYGCQSLSEFFVDFKEVPTRCFAKCVFTKLDFGPNIVVHPAAFEGVYFEWIQLDDTVELKGTFQETFQTKTLKCRANSKWINLAFEGQQIEIIS